jgi:capsular polysaccharide biosynthesis protein
MWSVVDPQRYTANAAAFVAFTPRPSDDPKNDDPFSGSPFVLQRMESYSHVATSSGFIRAVADELGRTDVQKLHDEVQVSATPGTVVLQVKVSDSNPQAAAQIADAIVARLEQSIPDAEAGGGERSTSPVQVVSIQPAIVPDALTGLPRWTRLLSGLLAGLVVGTVAIFFTPFRNDPEDESTQFAHAESTQPPDADRDRPHPHEDAEALSEPSPRTTRQ